MKNIILLVMVPFFTLMTAMALWADVPAPPANQVVGVNDGVFSDLAEADCRFCHENPDQFSVEDETIPDRHHLLVNTLIPESTDAPYGTPGELFTCLACHAIDTSSGVMKFLVEKDCVACHTQDSFFELTVHHRTDLALGNLPQGPDCQACHGSIVDNIEDGHFIPTYDPSLVTPKRSGGTGLPLNSEGNGAGACDYCHATGTGDPLTPGIDSDSGILVHSNEENHHETGFWGGVGAHGFVCSWCHDFTLPDEQQIRVCENCHGLESLHNIAVDSDGNGEVIVGGELPGYSHVGHDDDCWGCHGYSTVDAPGAGPITPYISSSNVSVMTAGTDTPVTLAGTAFTNIVGTFQWVSDVGLTAADGVAATLIPDSITQGTLTVTIPGTTPPGNYTLQAVKGEYAVSNPVVISIKPAVEITTITCFKCQGVVKISGSGFGDDPPEGAQDYLNVTEDGVPLNVTIWTDSAIYASGASCEGAVTVNALFGTATYPQ